MEGWSSIGLPDLATCNRNSDISPSQQRNYTTDSKILPRLLLKLCSETWTLLKPQLFAFDRSVYQAHLLMLFQLQNLDKKRHDLTVTFQTLAHINILTGVLLTGIVSCEWSILLILTFCFQ